MRKAMTLRHVLPNLPNAKLMIAAPCHLRSFVPDLALLAEPRWPNGNRSSYCAVLPEDRAVPSISPALPAGATHLRACGRFDGPRPADARSLAARRADPGHSRPG